MANTELKYLQSEKLTIDPNLHLAEESGNSGLKLLLTLSKLCLEEKIL